MPAMLQNQLLIGFAAIAINEILLNRIPNLLSIAKKRFKNINRQGLAK